MLSFIFVFTLFGHADLNCVMPREITRGVNIANDESQSFYPGELLEMTEYDRATKRAKVKAGREVFWIEGKALKKTKREHCQPKLCVKVNTKTSYYDDPSGANQVTASIAGVFQVVSRSGSSYRVLAGTEYIWLKGSQMKSQKVSCEASQDVAENTQPSGSSAKLKYGIEAGYIPTVSSEPLNNLITPRPAAGVDVNDDAFDSPFIESLNDGSGWYFGATLEMPIFWNLLWRNAVGYKSKSMEYVSRPNPHDATTSFITYDELATVPVAVDFTFVYAATTLKYSGWRWLGIQWQPGFNLGIDYCLDELSVEFRTAPQKITAYSVASGYSSIEFMYGPRWDMEWSVFLFSINANLSSYGFEPNVSLGVQF